MIHVAWNNERKCLENIELGGPEFDDEDNDCLDEICCFVKCDKCGRDYEDLKLPSRYRNCHPGLCETCLGIYLFRRDDGVIIWVDFELMMSKVGGKITLPDGMTATEVRKPAKVSAKVGTAQETLKPIVSDSLGFTAHQLAEFEADRVANGFTGVEFKPDPRVPEFYQAHFSGRDEWRRYAEHRGLFEKNGGLGSAAALSPEILRRAMERARDE